MSSIMASSSSKSISILFIAAAAFVMSAAFFPSPSSCASFAASSEQKVNLSVYYETLCPACAQFIVQDLLTIFNNGIIDIVNLKLIPWGNARLDGTNTTIICQHGPAECQLNTIQACAIDIMNNVDKSYGLISCMELNVIEGKQRDWHECFQSLGLPDKLILSCANSTNGTKIDILLSQETARLVPPHTFVPWVVVNNQSIGKDFGNFTSYICNEYKGQSAPEACSGTLTPQSKQITDVTSSDHTVGCAKESFKAMNLTSEGPLQKVSDRS